jgi:hypothetical protein
MRGNTAKFSSHSEPSNKLSPASSSTTTS